MSARVLIIDRDGALIERPAQAAAAAAPPAAAQLRFLPGVFAALTELSRHGYELLMLARTPQLQPFILETFSSQGIRFAAVIEVQSPAASLDRELRERAAERAACAVIGDGTLERELAATLGVRALTVRRSGPPTECWGGVVQQLIARRAALTRRTRETRIRVQLDLDAAEPVVARTGIGFFDHMLEQLAQHGGFALELECAGDLGVDEHHTVEDCALALGQALRGALGGKLGIARYGFLLPMDESAARVALDLSGRPFAQFTGRFGREAVGGLPTELVPHFFRSLAEGLGAAIHIEVQGENAHHMIEACFKSVGRALRQAVRREAWGGVPSTKGVL